MLKFVSRVSLPLPQPLPQGEGSICSALGRIIILLLVMLFAASPLAAQNVVVDQPAAAATAPPPAPPAPEPPSLPTPQSLAKDVEKAFTQPAPTPQPTVPEVDKTQVKKLLNTLQNTKERDAFIANLKGLLNAQEGIAPE